MSTRTRHPQRERREPNEQPTEIRTTARRFGALNLVAGLLGLVGPAVWGNDDDGLVNVADGRFLGLVAVNGPHAAVHALHGAMGLRASRDASSARRYMRRSALFFGLFAAVGWKRFGFEPGIYRIAGLALDRWGNLGHAVLAVVSAYAWRER